MPNGGNFKTDKIKFFAINNIYTLDNLVTWTELFKCKAFKDGEDKLIWNTHMDGC